MSKAGRGTFIGWPGASKVSSTNLKLTWLKIGSLAMRIGNDMASLEDCLNTLLTA
jgi:hypothetical protein